MEFCTNENIVQNNFVLQNLEEKQGLQVHLEEQMDSLWHKLQEEVVSFKSSTEEKRRIYNDLLAKDKKGVAEVAENNKKIQKLMVCKSSHRQLAHIHI